MHMELWNLDLVIMFMLIQIQREISRKFISNLCILNLKSRRKMIFAILIVSAFAVERNKETTEN